MYSPSHHLNPANVPGNVLKTVTTLLSGSVLRPPPWNVYTKTLAMIIENNSPSLKIITCRKLLKIVH